MLHETSMKHFASKDVLLIVPVEFDVNGHLRTYKP